MVNKLIISNVLHRPIRTAVSVLAVAIEVAMVILVVGLCHGLVNDSAKRVEGVGADILVRPPGSSFIIGMSEGPMPIKIGDRLRELPRVLAVAPTFVHVNSVRSLDLIYGIDLAVSMRVSGGFVYHAGGPFQAPYDILVDDIYAHANHSKVGQTINLLNHDFRIAGIVEHGKGARMFHSAGHRPGYDGRTGQSLNVLCQVHRPRLHRTNRRCHSDIVANLYDHADQRVHGADDLE